MAPLSLKSLSQALKAVRRHRGLTVLQVATRMGMAKRTYEYFEGEKGGLRLDLVAEFAQATDSDAYAILIAALLGAPDFAAASVESKPIALLLSALGRLEPELSAGLAQLTARDVASAWNAAFDDLIALGRTRSALAKSCAAEGDTPTPEPPPNPLGPGNS